MLFDSSIAAQQRGIQAFLDDPDRSAMLLRSDPDLEFQAARFLAQWGQGEDESEISFALAGTFTTPADFYREAEAGLQEVVQEIVEILAESEVYLRVPTGVRWEEEDSVVAEVLFAEYLEEVARAFATMHKQVIFVLRFDDVHDPLEAGYSLQRLGGALASSVAKLIVLDDRQNPRFPRLRSTRRRVAQRDFTIGSDAAGLFETLLTDPQVRVMELRCGDTAGDRLEKGFFSRTGSSGYFRVQADFMSRAQFCNAIYLVAKAHFDAISEESAPPNVYDLRAMRFPELSLTDSLERLAAQLFSPDESVAVEIEPYEIQDLDGWNEFVTALRGAAVSRRIRFVLLAEQDTPLPPLCQETLEWAVQDFLLPMDDMQGALEKSLKDPELPRSTRLNHMILLGGLYVAKNDFDSAIPLLGESVTLSEEEGTPEQKINSWWSLGNGLQRSGRYDLSENSFAEAASVALDQKNDVAAAQSFMGVGNARFMGEQYEAAIEVYEVAKKYWLNSGQVFGQLYADIWIGEAHRKLQSFEDAEKVFKEVLTAYQEMKEPFEDMAEQGAAEVYARLARLYQEIDRKAEASACDDLAKQGGCEGVHEVPL